MHVEHKTDMNLICSDFEVPQGLEVKSDIHKIFVNWQQIFLFINLALFVVVKYFSVL